MAVYFTNVGPKRGAYLYRDSRLAGAIGVLEALGKSMPIGRATSVGWGLDGVTVWRLTIDHVELPGVWVVIDREFRPTQ